MKRELCAVWRNRVHLWSPETNRTLCGCDAHKWESLAMRFWDENDFMRCRACERAAAKWRKGRK